MRMYSAIATVIAFFALSVMTVGNVSYSSPLYFFAVSLVEYPLLSHILYLGIVMGGAFLFMHVAYEGEQIADKPFFEDWKAGAQLITVVFVMFMALATLAGYSISHNFAVGCDGLGACLAVSRSLSPGEGLVYFFSALANIFYPIIFLGLMVIFGVAVGILLPSFAAGVVALSTRHPAEGLVDRSLRQLRPDKAAERELMRILNDQDAREEDVEKLLSRLWPWDRWAKRIEYRRRAREARRLREMAENKRRAFEEESGLARSFHEMERARRRASDRR